MGTCALGASRLQMMGEVHQILFGADTRAVIARDSQTRNQVATRRKGGPRATVRVLTAVLCPTRLPGPQTWGSRPPHPLPPRPRNDEMSSSRLTSNQSQGSALDRSRGQGGERSRRAGWGAREEFAGGVGRSQRQSQESGGGAGPRFRGPAGGQGGAGAGRGVQGPGRGGAKKSGQGSGAGRGSAGGPSPRALTARILHTPCWPHSMLNVGPPVPKCSGATRRRQEGGHGAVAVHPGGLPRTARLSLVPLILLRLLP